MILAFIAVFIVGLCCGVVLMFLCEEEQGIFYADNEFEKKIDKYLDMLEKLGVENESEE